MRGPAVIQTLLLLAVAAAVQAERARPRSHDAMRFRGYGEPWPLRHSPVYEGGSRAAKHSWNDQAAVRGLLMRGLFVDTHRYLDSCAAKKRPGFDVNGMISRRGGSLLHAAAFAGNDKVVAQLMASGANPNILDSAGLDVGGAIMHGWDHRFRNLHDQPTKIAEQQHTFVGTAASFNRAMKRIVKHLNVTGGHVANAARIAWASGLAVLLSHADLNKVYFPPQLLDALNTVSLLSFCVNL